MNIDKKQKHDLSAYLYIMDLKIDSQIEMLEELRRVIKLAQELESQIK